MLRTNSYHLFDNLAEGIQVIDTDWNYVYVNYAAASHGQSQKAVLEGSSVLRKYPGIEKTEMFAYLDKCMNSRVPEQITNHFEFPDGRKGWFELIIEPVDEGIMIISVDITPLKESYKFHKADEYARKFLETKISEQKKFLKQFALNVSKNYEMATGRQESYIDDTMVYLEKLKPVTDKLNEVYEELKNLNSFPENNNVKKYSIDLDKCTAAVINLLQKEIINANATISCDFSEAEKIHYSKSYFNKILFNLLENSLRYRQAERPLKIYIKSFLKNGWIHLSISDNGSGFDVHINKNKLFQLGQVFHKHPKARGYGLYFTKKLVELSGGEIYASSTPGAGSTFKIKLAEAS